MLLRTTSAVFLLLFVAGLHGISCQDESPSSEPKSTFALAKENTITHHTGLNVTTGDELMPTGNLTSNATEMLGPAPAPSEVLSGGPDMAAEPTSATGSGPAQAPVMAPALPPAVQSNISNEMTEDNSTDSAVAKTPAATPAVTLPAALKNITDYVGSAIDKDVTTQAAGVASSSRYGSVIAGTLVAAVVMVGIAATVLVWRRRSGSAYQGLHDTEMAMIRREH